MKTMRIAPVCPTLKLMASVAALAAISGLASAEQTYYWNSGVGQKEHGQNLADPYLWGNNNPGSVTSLDSAGTFYFRWSFTEPIRTSASVTWSTISFAQNQYAPFSGSLDLTQTNETGEVTGYASVLASNKLNIGAGGGHAQLTLTAGTIGTTRTPSGNPSIWLGDGNGNGNVTKIDIAGAHAAFQTSYEKRTIIGQGHSTYLTVRDGGLYSGNFFIGVYGGSSRYQRESELRVTGEGSRLEVPTENTGDLIVGSTSGGNALVITNGASMTVACTTAVKLGSPVNGVSPGTHNRFVVTDGSTFTTAGSLWAGLNSASNLFEVSGGSTATIGGVLYSDNGSLQGFPLYGNRMRLTGEGTVVNANGGLYAGYLGGHGSCLEVTDGAVLNVAANKSFTVGNASCPDCSMIITNGAKVTVGKATQAGIRLLVGCGDGSPRCSVLVDNATLDAGGIACGTCNKATATDCALTIRNGADVKLGDIYLGDYGDHATLTLADSTLACSTLYFGLTGGKDHVFNLSGAASRVTTGTFQFKQATTWNVTVPETEPDEALVTCYVFSVAQPSTLNVTVTALSNQCKTRLLHATGADISDATMANLAVNLPDDYRLRRSADKRDLVISYNRGLMLLFR